jgi:hypothetical protein
LRSCFGDDPQFVEQGGVGDEPLEADAVDVTVSAPGTDPQLLLQALIDDLSSVWQRKQRKPFGSLTTATTAVR